MGNQIIISISREYGSEGRTIAEQIVKDMGLLFYDRNMLDEIAKEKGFDPAAFAGVDETNIRDMFRLMVEFEFNFMINSQILWGDYDTVPGLAIYQLIRPENAKFVSVIRYIWNGKKKIMTTGSTEQRS